MANSTKLVFIVEDNKYQQKMLEVHFKEVLGNYQVLAVDAANTADMHFTAAFQVTIQ